MTAKIKRKGFAYARPKADFGSIFTSYIAPAANAIGAIADSASAKSKDANNQTNEQKFPESNSAPQTENVVNENTTIPSDPTKAPTMRLGGRRKAWIGAAIGAATSIAGSLFGASAKKKAQRKQESIEDWNESTQEAASMSTALNNSSDYQEDYLRQFRTAARLGKTLGAKKIYITDGGDATKIDNNTFLLRGGSHEDVNETGQTGIGINVGGNEIEAEGGEVAQRKGNSLRIFSAQPILNGISPAQAVAAGANKNAVFNAQQRFKRVNGLKDDGNKVKWGTQDYVNAAKVAGSYLPIVGTLEDAYELYQHPSLEQAGWTALGAASDILGGRAIVKGLKYARLASKAYKANKNILAAKQMIDAKNYRNAQLIKGSIVPGADNVVQRNIVEPLKKRCGGRVKADLGIQAKGNFNPFNYAVTKGFSPLTKWVRSNRNDNVIASALYESGLFDKFAYKNMLRDIHTLTGLGDNPDNPEQNQAVMTPAYTSSSTRVLSQLAKTTAEEPYIIKQLLGLPSQSMIAAREAESAASAARRNYNVARMQAANAEARFDPLMNQVRYSNGQPIIVDAHGGYGSAKQISQASHNMTSGTNPIAYAKAAPINAGKRAADFARRLGSNMRNGFETDGSIRPWVWNTLIGAAGADVAAGYGVYKYRQANKAKSQAQLDANGKPISPYIARQDSTTKAQAPAKQATPAAKAKATAAPAKAQAVPNAIARRDTTSRDTTRNYVVSQYQKNSNANKANAAKASAKPTAQKLYGLNDNETKTINGQTYVRRGNSVYNTTTKVRYDYANGKYTGNHKVYGVGDYSKVGKNFNEAFDAARAAGASQFKYNAGKYNQYTTNKETDAKKEALNRKIGAKRIAKRLGGNAILPVKDIRSKAALGTASFVPYNKRYTSIYNAPNYNNDTELNGTNALGDNEVVVTASRIKPTWLTPNNDAKSLLKEPVVNTKSTGSNGNKSRAMFSNGDYIGLGIDTLAGLSTGLINYNAAGKYYLPDRAPIIATSKLPTNYNIAPQLEEAKRQRERLTSDIYNNTSSSVAALNRARDINLATRSDIAKLYATKENEENKMLTEDAKNQQGVAAQNVTNQLARESEIAKIKNDALQSKADALNVSLSGLSQAWTNFWTAGRTAYEDEQARLAMVASSKDATPTKLIEMGVRFDPSTIAALYKTSKDEKTKQFYLNRLTDSQRKRYGIN